MLQGYFVGTFLMLDTASSRPMFSFNPVEGVKSVNPNIRPKEQGTVHLVLDGQQRLTSLFYALYEPNIHLRNVKNPQSFF